MGRTPRPIGATGAAHRELDGFVHGHEVVHGDCVVVQETERDPARQPFGLGEVAPACEAVFLGQAIGLGDVSLLQGLACQDRPFPPPQVGPHQVVRRVDEEFDR